MEQSREKNPHGNTPGHAKRLYTLFDKKTGSWDNPFAAATHGEAERILQRAMKDPGSLLGQYPEDFSLWNNGIFDPATGKLEEIEHSFVGELVQIKDQIK